MKKKLIFIRPAYESTKLECTIPVLNLEPLVFAVLASVTPESVEIDIIDEIKETCTYPEADVVAITGFSFFIPRAYQIAMEYRKRGTIVIMGGIHVSNNQEEALKFANTIVVGEAESIWGTVIEDFIAGSLKRKYIGEKVDLKLVPLPDHTIGAKYEYLSGAVYTSRGCPMDCDFCSVTPYLGKEFRRRSIKDVLDEIERLPYDDFFFVDDNLYGKSEKHKEDFIELMEGMIERKIQKRWWAQVSFNFGDDIEVVKLAKKAGAWRVLMGIESISVNELKSMKKDINVNRRDDYIKIIQKIASEGICVTASLMFGIDGSTLQDAIETYEFVKESNLCNLQVFFMTPLPGTKIYEQMKEEKRLLYTNYPRDWMKLDCREITYRPIKSKAQELLKNYYWFLTKIYSDNEVEQRYAKNLQTVKNKVSALQAYEEDQIMSKSIQGNIMKMLSVLA